MELPVELYERAGCWEALSRWEGAELGRDLRRLGWTYSEVMAVIPVPKGTLAGWCRDIRLTPTQIAAIEARVTTKKGIPRDTQLKRRLEIEAIRVTARNEAPHLANQGLWVAGTALYWAEGSKTRNHLELANADERLLCLFIRWVREYLDFNAEFVLQLHLHTGNDEDSAKDHWRSSLNLPRVHFYKTFIKPAGTGHRKNKLPQGVCRVRVRKASDNWNRVMEWIDYLATRLNNAGEV